VPSLSTHVLDAAAGGPRAGVAVTVHAVTGPPPDGPPVASAVTDADGRIPSLATDLVPGSYRIEWSTAGAFVSAVAVTVELSEDRHYHVPLLVSPASAVTYLGV
jgi:5-hydroxyisourate hydrolase